MITGKNIDDVLKKDYFEQIKVFFKKCSSKSERAKYIEEKYGASGWSVCERGDFIDSIYCNSKGIEFLKRTGINTEKVQMSWIKVAERIEKIIESESQISLF